MLGWLLILAGMVEALWGLGQVYGYLPVEHALFPLTGSFYNPGPYAGFLAMVFPVCLWEVAVRYHSGRKGIGYWTALAGLVLLGCVIPATMSRTAWIAAGVSSVYVYVRVRPDGIRSLSGRLSGRCRYWKAVALLLLLAVGSAVYLMKKDSADGRLLMWKVSIHAIMGKPLTGYGWDHVPGAYGRAQEEYFASGDYTETEAFVAGSPEYVFNEYLQVAMAWGIPAAAVLVGLTCLAVRGADRSGHGRGKAAALLSLMVFSSASYPFQFPLFMVCWGLSVIGGLRDWYAPEGHRRHRAVGILLQLVVGLFCIAVLSVQYRRSGCQQEWEKLRTAYRMGDYETVRDTYAAYGDRLAWNARYNFEYAHACQKLGLYLQSDSLFRRALEVSSDPMILNMLGKNSRARGDYAAAEEYYLRSTHRLPNRIYPYYLLAKLYAEKPTGIYTHRKLKEAVRMVLEKEPKVQSTAIREMREEVKRLLKE